MRRPSWIVAGALSVGLVTTGHAEPLLDGRKFQNGAGIEVGAVVHTGHSEYASNNTGLSPNVQGLVIRDRNGVTSRMVIGLIVAIGGALAQSGPKSVSSKSYVSGDYRVTETTTTYYSEAEKAEMSAATSKSIDGLFSAKHSDFELHLFSRDRFGFGDASGWKMNMYIGGGDTIAFETGFGVGRVSSLVDNAGTPTRIDYDYLGMPFRLSAVAGPLRLALTYEWNWSKYGIENTDRQIQMDDGGAMSVKTASHPWHAEVSTILLRRFALSGGVTAQTLQPKLGYYLEAGIFF